MMYKFSILSLLTAISFSLFSDTSLAVRAYKKAVADDAVVKNKLFPKKKKVELNLDAGMVLNQSYINSFAFHGTLNYFKSEEWGFGLEAIIFSNSDKFERTCIESFYNDSINEIGPECRGNDTETLTGGEDQASYGPAYVPIRELNMILAATVVWNPVYGKQLFFMKATGYFDLYTTFGGGIATSNFYPEETTIKGTDGHLSRGKYDKTSDNNPGTPVTAEGTYGLAGRPAFEEQTHPLFTAGVGQKYHFGKRFNIKIELRNYTLLGTDSGIEPFFLIWSGIGMRL